MPIGPRSPAIHRKKVHCKLLNHLNWDPGSAQFEPDFPWPQRLRLGRMKRRHVDRQIGASEFLDNSEFVNHFSCEVFIGCLPLFRFRVVENSIEKLIDDTFGCLAGYAPPRDEVAHPLCAIGRDLTVPKRTRPRMLWTTKVELRRPPSI